MSYVYGLVDSSARHTVRYVGITQKTPSKRLRGHISSSKDLRLTDKKGFWIRSVISQGNSVEVIVLEHGVMSRQRLNSLEIWWINLFAMHEVPLENSTTGGSGNPGPVSDAVRAKMPKAAKDAWDRNFADPEWMSAFKSSTSLGTQKYWDSESEAASKALKDAHSVLKKEYWASKTPEERKQLCAPVNELSADHYTRIAEKTKATWESKSKDEKSLHSEKISELTKAAMQDPEVRARQLEGLRNRDPEKKALQYFKSARTMRYNRAKKNGWVLELTPVTHHCKDSE